MKAGLNDLNTALKADNPRPGKPVKAASPVKTGITPRQHLEKAREDEEKTPSAVKNMAAPQAMEPVPVEDKSGAEEVGK
jgi:hypothetical protein